MEKIIFDLNEIFEIEEGCLKPETVLDELDEWDSMAKLSLIVYMSDEYSIKLTSDDIRNFDTVNDIVDFILKKK